MIKVNVKSMFLALLFVGSIAFSQAQEVDKKVLNWYNNHKVGMGTDKALKSMKKKEAETVIVAIIDSGMDVDHEDFQGRIWTNTKEIPGNGIDDDGNGYADDIHGWNFLGNANGENQGPARLEVTRIYARLRDRFADIEEADVATEDRKDYELYLETKKEVEKNLAQYGGMVEQMEQFRDQMLPMLPAMIGSAIGKENYTKKDVDKWKPKDLQSEQMKQIALAMLSGELNEEVINEQIDQIHSMVNYHYNVDYNDRSLIGDDYLDMNDVGYGNNDVQGPDAVHGTHVGGIVGALRGNGLGGDGVADNVLLMSLRAVPDGDEFDKDIALAIRYAVDNGAKIINASFGKAYAQIPEAVYEAIRYAEQNDVLFVHAAGNSALDLHENPNFPANMFPSQTEPFNNYLSIGASTRVHKERLPAVFSNYGQTRVDVFAPGFEIYNAIPGNKYKKLQGTSMAAPMVSGVAAIIKGYYPELKMSEVRQIILDSAKDFSETDQMRPGSEELVKFGILSATGGVVDVRAALKLAEERTKK